ncbi:MAG: homocysteine S-methyltransferase family protein [Bacteroidaceae bacterium]|nr:homocysteine S-methyltransferase family protein [Bacteroidaceae bacterium]
MTLADELRRRILILDGGMGTEIQKSGLQYDGNNDALPMTHPELIRSIHSSYVEAGADIICTCSFGANAVSQQGYCMTDKIRELNIAAAHAAREAADACIERKVWVMGSMGPTSKSLTIIELMMDPSETLDYDGLERAYEEQADALIEGGVDGFIVETITDLRNAEAALSAIKKVQERRRVNLPVMISATLMNVGACLMTGSSVQDFITFASSYNPVSIGLNCSFGAKDMIPHIKEIAETAKCAVSVYPNAGMPTSHGYDDTPCDTAEAVESMAKAGLINIAGGCCGTTPEHIREIADRLRDITPRPIGQ